MVVPDAPEKSVVEKVAANLRALRSSLADDHKRWSPEFRASEERLERIWDEGRKAAVALNGAGLAGSIALGAAGIVPLPVLQATAVAFWVGLLAALLAWYFAAAILVFVKRADRELGFVLSESEEIIEAVEGGTLADVLGRMKRLQTVTGRVRTVRDAARLGAGLEGISVIAALAAFIVGITVPFLAVLRLG